MAQLSAKIEFMFSAFHILSNLLQPLQPKKPVLICAGLPRHSHAFSVTKAGLRAVAQRANAGLWLIFS
jgi:hypothetical protein